MFVYQLLTFSNYFPGSHWFAETAFAEYHITDPYSTVKP